MIKAFQTGIKDIDSAKKLYGKQYLENARKKNKKT